MRRNNPYRPQAGGEPPALVGRDVELERVQTTLIAAREGGPMRPTVFIGLRGMGKTALLRRAMAMARSDEAVVVGIEATRNIPLAVALADGVSEAKRVASVGARFRDAVDGLRKQLPGASFDLPNDMGKLEIDLRGDDTQAPLGRSLDELNAIVRRRGSYLVLAIDEIQEADVADLAQIALFVHATAGTANPVVLFGAGLTNSAMRLHEAKTYTERYRFPRLEGLSAEDTKAAIAIPAEKQAVTFTADALDLLARETAGYPFFIQEYASLIWTMTDGSVISVADVQQRILGIRAELDEQFYAPRFARLTPRELRYALAMASLGTGPHSVGDVAAAYSSQATSSSINSIRNQLNKKEVIFNSSAGHIEFRMPLSELYIERNRAALAARAQIATP